MRIKSSHNISRLNVGGLIREYILDKFISISMHVDDMLKSNEKVYLVWAQCLLLSMKKCTMYGLNAYFYQLSNACP